MPILCSQDRLTSKVTSEGTTGETTARSRRSTRRARPLPPDARDKLIERADVPHCYRGRSAQKEVYAVMAFRGWAYVLFPLGYSFLPSLIIYLLCLELGRLATSIYLFIYLLCLELGRLATTTAAGSA